MEHGQVSKMTQFSCTKVEPCMCLMWSLANGIMMWTGRKLIGSSKTVWQTYLGLTCASIVRHRAKHFVCIISVLWGGYCEPHPTSDETETQGWSSLLKTGQTEFTFLLIIVTCFFLEFANPRNLHLGAVDKSTGKAVLGKTSLGWGKRVSKGLHRSSLRLFFHRVEQEERLWGWK